MLLQPPAPHWFRNRLILAVAACASMSLVPALNYWAMAHPVRSEVLIGGLATRSLPILLALLAGCLAASRFKRRGSPNAAVATLNGTVFVALFTTLFVGLR